MLENKLLNKNYDYIQDIPLYVELIVIVMYFK